MKRVKIKPKRKRAKGRGKGQQFERDWCRKLSKWISHGKADDWFWRSAMSGGRATLKKKKGERSNQAGDLAAIHPKAAKYTRYIDFECKFNADLEWGKAVYGRPSAKILEHWRKLCEEAAYHKKLPFLIARQNHQEDIIALPTAMLALDLPARPLVIFRKAGFAVYRAKAFLRAVDPAFFLTRAQIVDGRGLSRAV